MNTKKRGLVFGGGGARGCYEIGVWQAFNEVHENFDCIAGTSIGAIIGAIYTQQTLERLIQFVYHLKPTAIAVDLFTFPENFTEAFDNRKVMVDYLAKYLPTGADITPLKDEFTAMFDYGKFMASPINYACMTFNVTKLKGEAFFKSEMTPENSVDIILASASCFPAFPMMEMNGDNYIDGGYEDNVPIDLVLQMGAEEVTAVNVHGPGRIKPVTADVPIRTIQPILPLQNFLDFTQEKAVDSMHIGYLETMKYLGRFAGYVYTFPKEDWPRIFVLEHFIKLQLDQGNLYVTKDAAKKTLQYALGYEPVPLYNKYQPDYHYGLVLEALAYTVGVNPIKLYNYTCFIEELKEKLHDLLWRVQRFSLDELKDRRVVKEIITSRHKEDIVCLFYINLKDNGGKLKRMFDPFVPLAEPAYHMALIWYCLEQYH